MRVLKRSAGDKLGVVGTVRNTVNVLREIRFDEIRDEAETPPNLLVLAPDQAEAERMATLLTGVLHAPTVTALPLNDVPRDLGRFDAIVVFDPHHTNVVKELQKRAQSAGTAVPVFQFRADHVDDEEETARVRAQIASRLPMRAPAFGRAFPAFRAAAAKAVIDETAKANAQFALVSNAPSVIPIVGSLASAGADFLVLTKNQLMLLFKIAAIYGRELHDQWGIIQEMVPVVGAGLFWRTLAREAASFIPLAGGTIPKVAIAYAGTVAAGKGAEVYYRSGHRPSRAQMRRFYGQALDTVKKLPIGRPEPPTASEPGPPAVLAGEDGRTDAETRPLPSGTEPTLS